MLSMGLPVNPCRNPVTNVLCRFRSRAFSNMPPSRPLQTPNVALLVETSLASGRDILRGIARYVRERGPWGLFHAPHGLEESAPAWLRRWEGDGIIARITTPAFARLLKDTGLPVVDVLGMVPDTGFPIVHVDDHAIARLGFEHFVERGFRKFAFIGVAGQTWARGGRNWSGYRRDAFCELAEETGSTAAVLEFTRRELEETSWDQRQDRLAEWLRELPKPVGLMVCSDQHGLHVLEACRRAGLRVPDQIAVLGVDNDEPLCEVCTPPLSSILPDHFGVGYQAAELLAQMMGVKKNAWDHRSVAPRGIVTRQSSDVLAVEDAAVAAALGMIREHACAGIGVDEIARAAGASRSVLQRRFRAVLGQSIHDHLVSTRMKRAVELLSSTEMPLAEVAERCGFRHQEYMGVVFRERLGKTPAQCRRGR